MGDIAVDDVKISTNEDCALIPRNATTTQGGTLSKNKPSVAE